MPPETRPPVETVNETLARLDDVAMRQKRFTANVAHELRTPVAILRARIDGLTDTTFRNELQRDVRRIQTIVDQLLITARLSEYDGPMDEAVDMVATARELVADYAPLVITNNRNIEFVGPKTRLNVRGNRQALKCVLSNLIDNALRAEPLQGVVIVRVSPGVMIEVVDHGDGVAHEMREMIFEPFWRGENTSQGAGLGLATVKELMALHLGAIDVEDTPRGGATFKLMLPPA